MRHIEIPLEQYADSRGSLSPIFRLRDVIGTDTPFGTVKGKSSAAYKVPLGLKFVETRLSKSRPNTIRGFHGDALTWKYMVCIDGTLELWLYDLKSDEKKRILLSDAGDNYKAVLIPPYYLNAHLSIGECSLLYQWSHYYRGPDQQWTVNPFDDDIGAVWTTLLGPQELKVSTRDKSGPSLLNLKKQLGIC